MERSAWPGWTPALTSHGPAEVQSMTPTPEIKFSTLDKLPLQALIGGLTVLDTLYVACKDVSERMWLFTNSTLRRAYIPQSNLSLPDA